MIPRRAGTAGAPGPARARRPGPARVAAALLVLGVATVAPGAPALRGARAQATVSAELRAEASRLFGALAQLRGVTAPGTPPRVVMRTREERRRFVAGELRRKYSPARLDAERRAMVAWGLVPPDFDLGGFLTDLVVEQAAAYYDPVGKVMVLANWLGPDEQREALTHELVHALQDRQMDLDAFLTGPAGRSDEALARQSLIEGEAVGVSLDLVLHRQGRDLASLPDVARFQQAIGTSATGPLLSRAPRFLRAMLTFPYTEGLGFVHQFRRRFPWKDLSALYRDPPRSSSQILHPERYLDRRQDPVPVAVPDLSAALGPGARRIIEDEAGEFGLRAVLGEYLRPGPDAPAAGWLGDRYAVWEDGGGALVLLALTLWDGDAPAAAFAEAYARLLQAKRGLPDAGPEAGLVAWTVGAQAFAVEQRGRAVLVAERVPAAGLEPIRALVWGQAPADAVLH